MTTGDGYRTLNFAWDQNTEPDFSYYLLYAGRASGLYTHSNSPTNMGTATSGTYTVNARGAWYFALTAVDTEGLQSSFSTEVSTTVL